MSARNHKSLRFLLLFAVFGCAALACFAAAEATEKKAPDAAPIPKLVKTIKSRANSFVSFLGFSADSRVLLYARYTYADHYQTVGVQFVEHDLKSGKVIRRSHRAQIDSCVRLVFTRYGKTFSPAPSISPKWKAVIWNIERGKAQVDLRQPKNCEHATPYVFSPDRKQLLGDAVPRRAGPTRDVLWDTATGRCRMLCKVPADGPSETACWKILDKPEMRPPRVYFHRKGGPFVFIIDSGWARYRRWVYGLIDVANNRIVPKAGSRPYRWNLSGHKDVWALEGKEGERGYRFRLAPNGRLLRLPSFKQLPIALVLDDPNTRYVTKYRTTLGVVVRPFGVFNEFMAEPLAPPPRPRWPHDQRPVWPGRFNEHDFRTPFRFTVLWHFKDVPAVGSLRLDNHHLSPDGRWLVERWFPPQKEIKPGEKVQPPPELRIWDLSSLLTAAAKKIDWTTPEQLRKKFGARFWESLTKEDWKNVAKENATGCHEVMIALANHPKQAVPMLKKWLGPPRDLTKVPQLIKDLDSSNFRTRTRAAAHLERIGAAATGLMKKARAKPASLEMKLRLDLVLNKIKKRAGGEELALLRVVDVLEHINTPEARRLLRAIAAGGYNEVAAEAAKTSLKELSRR